MVRLFLEIYHPLINYSHFLFFFQIFMRSLSTIARSFKYFSSRKVMYFDYQATTPVDYRVLDAMMPYFT